MNQLPMTNPDYINNPAPYWHQLREKTPIYWSDAYNFWVITKYEDVESFVKRPDDFSSSVGPAGGLRTANDDTAEEAVGFLPMIQNDPPEHTRLRSLLARSFTSRRIAELEPRIQRIAEDLVRDIKEKYVGGDFYKDFASPFPVTVIAELLGISKEYYERLKFWNEALGVGSGQGYTERQRIIATRDMTDALKEIIEEKRSNPQDDLISSLVQTADEDGERLKPTELVGFCKLLWIAGNETTTNLICNASLVLQEQPVVLERLRSDKSLIPQFVEEALRLEGPVNGLFRRVTRDLEYKGTRLRKNDNVWLMFASANRDGNHFEKPEEFIIERSPNDHLAFGKGVHFCMGAALVRLEAKVAFELLVDVLPNFKLEPMQGLRIPTPVLRGWLKLPMERLA